MSTSFESVSARLLEKPKRWLVTGGCGFIGSNLIEVLLHLNQEVISLDNLSTGHTENLDVVRSGVAHQQAGNLSTIVGDLADYETCLKACDGVDFILHQGALGSVPGSIDDPVASHQANTTGTLNLFASAKESGIRRVVYASSSAVYGDDDSMPKAENLTGRLLSPYAATKAIAESYAEAFSQCYDMEFSGLRYFNVFGPRQDPEGAYAAVIPAWISAMLNSKDVYINGDGETSRDFIFVADVVQANILAATAPALASPARAFNVAMGHRTSLNELFRQIRKTLSPHAPDLTVPDPIYRDFRTGDIRHSHADCSRARDELGFLPTHDLAEGLALAMPWYIDHAS